MTKYDHESPSTSRWEETTSSLKSWILLTSVWEKANEKMGFLMDMRTEKLKIANRYSLESVAEQSENCSLNWRSFTPSNREWIKGTMVWPKDAVGVNFQKGPNGLRFRCSPTLKGNDPNSSPFVHTLCNVTVRCFPTQGSFLCPILWFSHITHFGQCDVSLKSAGAFLLSLFSLNRHYKNTLRVACWKRGHMQRRHKPPQSSQIGHPQSANNWDDTAKISGVV